MSLWIFDLEEVQARWRGLIEDGYRSLTASPPNLKAADAIAERVGKAIAGRARTLNENREWQKNGMIGLMTLIMVLLAVASVVPENAHISQLPVWVLLLGAAGGAASGLVTLRTPIEIRQHRRLALPAAFSRAVLGALTGGLAYLIVSSGLVTFNATNGRAIDVFVALAGGYSERLLGQFAARVEAVTGTTPRPETADDQPADGTAAASPEGGERGN